MTVASVRLTKEEQEFLERLVAEGVFSSISEALKAGVRELMQEEKIKSLRWKTFDETRTYFAKKKTHKRGLEDDHNEEDSNIP
ncbi:MAG: ribbon-helix-helix domain-containing protein [Candidatus Thorarchaeota archaeon]|nr:ribbon-helix-helix domain-containing protein [Candidatus Thorarchaeota archaeon]